MAPEKENKLKRLLDVGSNVRVSLALFDLASGFQLLAHPDVAFHPASTFKVGVMMEVFHQAAQGAFSLDDLLEIKNTFTSIADQSEFTLSPADDSESDLYRQIGESISLRELTRLMIVTSSNLATNLLTEKGRRRKCNPLHAGAGNGKSDHSTGGGRPQSLCAGLEQLRHCTQSDACSGPPGKAQRGQPGSLG